MYRFIKGAHLGDGNKWFSLNVDHVAYVEDKGGDYIEVTMSNNARFVFDMTMEGWSNLCNTLNELELLGFSQKQKSGWFL